MKKIDVSALLGTLGAPFLKQTFVHTDEQVKEVVDALVKSLISTYTTNDVIILHGCVISGTTTKAITEGAIYYNGEVYLVDAASGLTAGADTWIFAVVTTYAAGDPVTYDDSTSHNQHRIDKIAFQVGDSGSDGYVADWDDAIVKYLALIQRGDWVNATMLNSWTVGGGGVMRFKKDIFGNVSVQGVVVAPNGTDNVNIFTLPTGYRPETQLVYQGFVDQGGGIYIDYELSINTNGQVVVNFLGTGGTGDIIRMFFNFPVI